MNYYSETAEHQKQEKILKELQRKADHVTSRLALTDHQDGSWKVETSFQSSDRPSAQNFIPR